MPNLLVTNVRSLPARVDELSCICYEKSIGIACITETWLQNDISDIEINIQGYLTYSRDRSDGRRCGGVVFYVRNDIPCTILKSAQSPDVESLWLLYRANQMPRSVSHTLIGLIYHPPDANSNTTVAHIISRLDNLTQLHPHMGIILVGDFNLMRDSVILSYPLKQTVTRPTRRNNILDKIYTNINKTNHYHNEPYPLPPIGSSDHNVVLLTAKTQMQSPNNNFSRIISRCNDHNGKVMLANALFEFNWISLYRM
jgi:exonuclease III